jgi:ATP-dependent DNA helicase RecQ
VGHESDKGSPKRGAGSRKKSTRRRVSRKDEAAEAAGADASAPDEAEAAERPRRSRRIDPDAIAQAAEELGLDLDDMPFPEGLQLEGEEEDEEPEPEPEVPQTGPVFTGEVALDTAEQRDEAMRLAARRLGISALHKEQREVLDAVLSGTDVLMVLPTGFGKSACYQIPSMILPKPVLVISPLLALMKDQYEKLQRLDVPCVRLDGTIRGNARKQALERIRRGERLLVMTTPETLASQDAAEALAKGGISLAAVDEAHCISEWGYDFRPAYLQIGERLRALGGPPVLALTATATEKVRLAIQRFVGMRSPRIVATSPHRSNLAFDVLHCSAGARLRALVRLALRVRRPGIIYCSTTREVDELYAVLQRFGVPSHRYHGKMSASERNKSQEAFMQRGRRTVMVATNAFGLGIDKSDIRYVMHYHAPASLEQYVQEAGRSGRDGRRANCILLYSPEDRDIHEALLSRSRVRPEQLYKLGAALAAWAKEEKVPSMQALALSAELGTRTTGALLALLEEATLVKWDQEAVFVTVPADEIEARSRELAGQFETLRTQDARRLDAVSEYAHTGQCRAVFLREYFGEEGSEPCGMCDVCRGQADRPSSFWEPLARPRGQGRGRRARAGARGRQARSGRGGRARPDRERRGRGERSERSERDDRDRRGRKRGQRRRRGKARSGGRPAAQADAPAEPGRAAGPRGNGSDRQAGGGERPAEEGARRGRRRGRRRGGRRGRRGRRPEGGSPPQGPEPTGDSPS